MSVSSSTRGSTPPAGTPARPLMLVILMAHVVAVLMYGVVLWITRGDKPSASPPPGMSSVRLGFFAMAAVAAVMSVLWTRMRLQPVAESADDPTKVVDVGTFQTQMVIALGLAEAPAVLGLVVSFLGGSWRDFLYPALASLAVILGVILPAVLRVANRR